MVIYFQFHKNCKKRCLITNESLNQMIKKYKYMFCGGNVYEKKNRSMLYYKSHVLPKESYN